MNNTAYLKIKHINKKINNDLDITDKEYSKLTNKILRYLYSQNKISRYRYLSLSSNEDNFSYIKHAIMLADWKYDNTKNTKLSTWRITCVNWEIYRIFNTKNNVITSSFNNCNIDEDLKIENCIKDDFDIADVDLHIEYQELFNVAKEILSIKAFSIFTMHFKHLNSIKEIARFYETSTREIKTSIKTSIQRIRKRNFASQWLKSNI